MPPSRGNVGSGGDSLLEVYRVRHGIYSDFEVRKEYPVRTMGPNDGLVSQVGSLGSLNTLAHTASQSFAFLELSAGIVNVIAWCQRIEGFIILA